MRPGQQQNPRDPRYFCRPAGRTDGPVACESRMLRVACGVWSREYLGSDPGRYYGAPSLPRQRVATRAAAARASSRVPAPAMSASPASLPRRLCSYVWPCLLPCHVTSQQLRSCHLKESSTPICRSKSVRVSIDHGVFFTVGVGENVPVLSVVSLRTTMDPRPPWFDREVDDNLSLGRCVLEWHVRVNTRAHMRCGMDGAALPNQVAQTAFTRHDAFIVLCCVRCLPSGPAARFGSK